MERKVDSAITNRIVEQKKELKNFVPKGIYCYDETGECPFWDIDETKPNQMNGYCHLTTHGDWLGKELSLLWDQVKECGINDEVDLEENDHDSRNKRVENSENSPKDS